MIIKLIRRPVEIANPVDLLNYEQFAVALDNSRNPLALFGIDKKINFLSSTGYKITRNKNYFMGVRS